jgi:hypothetical protein
MPKWDQLRPLPDHVVAPLLRALMCIPRRPESRLILEPVKEARAVLDD